ncbi:MAG: hypothetical protein ACTHM9_02500 [Gemmatimonadales bacterium]
MRGCLTAPFRVLGCLGMIAVLTIGWLYRDSVVREARGLLGRAWGPSTPASRTVRGRPGARALKAAEAKIDSLNGWRADSIVLTPSEVASLLGKGLSPAVRGELDSLEVELLDGEVRVRARLRTARLPRDLLGPVGVVLQAQEPVEATGPLRVTGTGSGEWLVRSFTIHGVPVPAPAIKRMVSHAIGGADDGAVPWKVPAGVRAIRLRPGTAILYGAQRS